MNGKSYYAALFFVSLTAIGGTTQQARAHTAQAGLREFQSYALGQIDQATLEADKMVEALKAQRYEEAQAHWRLSRLGWERSETFVGEFFSSFDTKIDSWPEAMQGYHAVEEKLFKGEGQNALALAEDLAANLKDLQKALVKKDLNLQGLLNGMANLAFEIGESKASGGESRISNNSLADMRANNEGLLFAYRQVFAAVLEQKDPKAAAQISHEIAEIMELLEVKDLAALNQRKLVHESEELAESFQAVADPLGLDRPKLED